MDGRSNECLGTVLCTTKDKDNKDFSLNSTPYTALVTLSLLLGVTFLYLVFSPFIPTVSALIAFWSLQLYTDLSYCPEDCALRRHTILSLHTIYNRRSLDQASYVASLLVGESKCVISQLKSQYHRILLANTINYTSRCIAPILKQTYKLTLKIINRITLLYISVVQKNSFQTFGFTQS
jgi:hypothetical protein